MKRANAVSFVSIADVLPNDLVELKLPNGVSYSSVRQPLAFHMQIEKEHHEVHNIVSKNGNDGELKVTDGHPICASDRTQDNIVWIDNHS